MSELRYGIDLGSGGLITDKETIAKLRKQPPLLPTDILKIAGFYRGYETNRPLAEHLELVALTQIVGDPDKELQASIRNSLTKSAAAEKRTLSAQDFDLEDLLDAADDEGPKDGFDFFFIKLHPITSDLNLIVETNEKQEQYHVIGVSPDLDKLPHPKQRVRRARRKA